MFDIGELFGGAENAAAGEAATNEALANTGSSYRLGPAQEYGSIPKNPYSGGRPSFEDVNAMPARQVLGHQNEFASGAQPGPYAMAQTAAPAPVSHIQQNPYAQGGSVHVAPPQANTNWAQNAMNVAQQVPLPGPHTDQNGKKEGGGLQKIVGLVGPLLALL